MIDLTPRPDRERWRDGVDPRDLNELIQARIDGRLSRRDLLRRAAALGLSAPVAAIALHITRGYADAAPAPQPAVPHLAAAGTVPATQPTKPAGTPQQGGTLVVGTNEEPDTLQPYLTQLVTGSDVYTGMLEPLLRYDSTQKLQPCLATAFKISSDGLTYTFTLRDGVTWHTGQPFTGQDVIDSWKIIVNKSFAAFSTLGWDKIKDIKVDGKDVIVSTTEVYAPFLTFVGAETPICPSKEIAKGVDSFKQQYGRAPIGTGPFKFVEWKPKQQITLARYDGYWGNKAKLDQIIIRILPDDNTQLVQLRTGEIQMASGAGALGATRVDEALGIDKIIVLEHQTLGWTHIDLKYIGFLMDTKVRQALDFATPTKQIIDKLLKGRAVPAVADQSPITWAYDPNIQPRPYDLNQAKQLLDEAGLKPGSDGVRQKDGQPLAIELWGIAGDAAQQQIIQVIAQSWNSIGVKTTPQFQDVSTIWGPEGYQWNKKMTGCLYAWFNSNDPDDMFYWHSSQIPSSPTGSGGNAIAYFNKFSFQAQIDDLTYRAAHEIDQEKRKQLYWQIQQLLHEQVPVIFMYWGKAFPAVAKNVGGHWPSAYNRLLWNAQDWYLAK